jgi:transposase
MNVLDGTVIGQCMQRHRHQEFIRFLNRLERDIPAGKLVHVVLDNYGSHKHSKVRAWLSRHPRWTFHFTPTSASWLNAVEGFFARLANRRLRRGVFHSLVDLQAAINRYLAEHNQSPRLVAMEPSALWSRPANFRDDFYKSSLASHKQMRDCKTYPPIGKLVTRVSRRRIYFEADPLSVGCPT